MGRSLCGAHRRRYAMTYLAGHRGRNSAKICFQIRTFINSSGHWRPKSFTKSSHFLVMESRVTHELTAG